MLASQPSPPAPISAPNGARSPSVALQGRFVSIGVKLALLSVLVVGVATAVAFFYATERERQRVIEAKRIAASMVADLLAQSLQAPLSRAYAKMECALSKGCRAEAS